MGKIMRLLRTEDVWDSHSNPKSGWSRLFSWPVFVIALYFRKWRVMGFTALFMLLNPVLFSAPTEESDNWMYQVVRAEERWADDGNRLVGLGYPQVLNTLSIPTMLYGLYSAYKRKPISTIFFTILSQGFNQWCMKEIIEHYEAVDSR